MILLSSLPRYLPLPLSPQRRRFTIFAEKNATAINRRAILWYKQDLRLDDHPGILEASKSHSVLPLYVFDRRILSRYSDETLELVLFALEDLRRLLQEHGSNLVVRFGNSETVIRDLVQEVKATFVFAEEDVENHLCELMYGVNEILRRDGYPSIVLWRTPFYHFQTLEDIPNGHEDFQKLQLPITLPITSHTNCAGSELEWGTLPTLDDLRKFMNEDPFKLEMTYAFMKEMSAKAILQMKSTKSRERAVKVLNHKSIQKKRKGNSVFVTRGRNIVGGGTQNVLNALNAYLRYLEGTARDDWQEVHEKLRDAESRDGASFFALFGPALCLGIVSRRRVHTEAIRYEKERNAGFLSPFGLSTKTVTAAADAVCSMEWYWLMALKCLSSDGGPYPIKIWRWNGYLIQYTAVGNKGPAILLVHGFGAFLEHYRHNMCNISEAGNRVWALTLLGFGKSEKPNVVYTELMWAELLRDFIIEVVGEPVHLVGNSIGGYFVAIMSNFWPTLVKSAVLINSAGDIIPGYAYQSFPKDREILGAAWLGARLLLIYLRLNVKSLLKNCYPMNPERADDGLIDEMLRASYDPGSPEVLESIFSFDLSLPLNYLLKDFEEKVLVIQGIKDPISDSKVKVAMLKEYCSSISISQLDAGHCPHDERPEDVNWIISEWIARVESKLHAGSFS